MQEVITHVAEVSNFAWCSRLILPRWKPDTVF